MIKENVLPGCQWPQNKFLEGSLALSHQSPHAEHCGKSCGPAGSQVNSAQVTEGSSGDKHALFIPSIIKPFHKEYSERSHWKGYEDAELLVRSKN